MQPEVLEVSGGMIAVRLTIVKLYSRYVAFIATNEKRNKINQVFTDSIRDYLTHLDLQGTATI